jgi:hypothetical protein
MSDLFNITLESAVLTGTSDSFDSAVTDGGDLSVDAAAAMGYGDYGLQCVINDMAAMYGQKDQAAPASNEIRFRIYIDPNGLTMAAGDQLNPLYLACSGAPWWLAAISLVYDGVSYYLVLHRYGDGGWVGQQVAAITDAEHYVEVHIVRAANAGSNDGTVQYWVDGVDQGVSPGFDNFDAFALLVGFRAGADGVDAGTNGTFYLDELRANDDGSEIGPSVYSLSFAVLIDGVDHTSELVHETLSINQSNDGLNSTCEFELIVQEVVRENVWTVGITLVEGPEPITDYTALAGTKVEVSVTDGATVYFAGILSRVTTRHMGATEVLGYLTPETEVLHLECHDFNALLEESVIDDLEEYGAMTDEELIDDIFAKYVVDIDFATFVDGGAYVFDEISFEGITVRQFLDTICAQSKCIWYVDYSKKLHYALEEANAPAWYLSDNPDYINSFAYFDDITKEVDATNLVNRVFVIGGPVSLWFIDQNSVDDYGSHRAIVQDTSLVDIDDIEGKGNAILAKFKDPIIIYTLRTYKDGLRAGMHVRVVSVFYNVDEELLINNLVITFPVDGDPVYEVTCGGLDSSAGSSASRSTLDEIYNIPPIIPGQLPLASRGWGHDMEFSAADADTVAWTAGTITTTSDQNFNIDAGNTDDPCAMTDVTYVYLDTAISSTTLRVTTDVTAAVGAGRIMVAVCAPASDSTEAPFQVFGGGDGVGVFITADHVAANTLTANEIAANTITATELNVVQLSAIAADMGILTAGEIKMYAGAWGAATGFRIVTTEICGRNAGVDQFKLDAVTGRITAINVDISGTITIGNPGDIDGSTINNDDGWTDDTTADQAVIDAAAANAHRILGVTGNWTVTDADTITWTGVVLRLGNGSDVNIINGNTGNMVAKSYLYYNGTTTLQITTNPNVIGGTHTLVAVAQNGASKASVQVVGGATYISGDWINTGTITAALMNVGTLSAITANMGTLTAGTIQTAAAGNNRVVINIADGIRGINAADVVQFQLDPSDGVAKAGAGAVVLDANGLSLVGSGVAGSSRKVRFLYDDVGTERTLGRVFSDWGGGANPCITWLTARRQAADPWPADVQVILAAIDAIAGTDVRLYVHSGGVVSVEGSTYLKTNSDVRVGGGLYVGSTIINPNSGDLWCGGRISTDGGTTKWELGGAHVTGDLAATRYIDVWIDGTKYKFLACV